MRLLRRRIAIQIGARQQPPRSEQDDAMADQQGQSVYHGSLGLSLRNICPSLTELTGR